MTVYFVRRLLQLIPTALAVLTLVFLLIHLVPGDPVELMLGERANETDKVALRHTLLLDLPIGEQYAHYVTGLVRGDLGKDIYSGEDVAAALSRRIPYTLVLSFCAMVIACGMSFPLGILSALYRGRATDSLASITSLLGVSMPSFWLGPMLIVLFALHLNVLPMGGADQASAIILPAFALGASLSAFLTRMIRLSVLEVLHQDYVRTATAKGLSRPVVVLKHVLRNALVPVVTVLGTQFGVLMAGAVITESIFDWPGIGRYFYQAFQQRNYPVIQGCVLFISLATMSINFVVDILYRFIDPRVELS
jgi:peptide/nickel transport system permease protein